MLIQMLASLLTRLLVVMAHAPQLTLPWTQHDSAVAPCFDFARPNSVVRVSMCMWMCSSWLEATSHVCTIRISTFILSCTLIQHSKIQLENKYRPEQTRSEQSRAEKRERKACEPTCPALSLRLVIGPTSFAFCTHASSNVYSCLVKRRLGIAPDSVLPRVLNRFSQNFGSLSDW